MGEDDWRQKYPPNSADILAMCDYIRTMQDVLDKPLLREVYQAAGTMFVAWIESLDMGSEVEAPDEPTSKPWPSYEDACKEGV